MTSEISSGAQAFQAKAQKKLRRCRFTLSLSASPSSLTDGGFYWILLFLLFLTFLSNISRYRIKLDWGGRERLQF